jgi:hypothetical protein
VGGVGDGMGRGEISLKKHYITGYNTTFNLKLDISKICIIEILQK